MSRTAKTGHRARSATLLASAALLLPLGAGAEAHGSAGQGQDGLPQPARAARTLDGTDTAHLHLVHQKEAVLYEEGSAGGALPGRMRATLTVGSVFSGTCTISTSHGSITGHGTAAPHGTGRYQSFSGTLTMTKGTGLYRHIHGRTALYGTFDRRTFALVVQTKGSLSY
jgi:hypothetical protein